MLLELIVPVLLLMGNPSGQTMDSEQPPPGFVLWSAERISETIERLDRELGEQSLVFEAEGNYDGHSARTACT